MQAWAVQGEGSAGSITGSEVVRDEFIGGLENTDQVVFLISVVEMVGRGACGGGGRRRLGVCGAGRVVPGVCGEGGVQDCGEVGR